MKITKKDYQQNLLHRILLPPAADVPTNTPGCE
jgi:hypothetical protein